MQRRALERLNEFESTTYQPLYHRNIFIKLCIYYLIFYYLCSVKFYRKLEHKNKIV